MGGGLRLIIVPGRLRRVAVLPPFGLPFVLLLLALLCVESGVFREVDAMFRLGFAFLRGFLALAYLLRRQFRGKEGFKDVADNIERLADCREVGLS